MSLTKYPEEVKDALIQWNLRSRLPGRHSKQRKGGERVKTVLIIGSLKKKGGTYGKDIGKG